MKTTKAVKLYRVVVKNVNADDLKNQGYDTMMVSANGFADVEDFVEGNKGEGIEIQTIDFMGYAEVMNND